MWWSKVSTFSLYQWHYLKFLINYPWYSSTWEYIKRFYLNISLSKSWANKNYSIQKHFEVDRKDRKKFGRRHIHVYISHRKEHFQSFSIMSSINTKLHLPKKSFWHLVLTLKKKAGKILPYLQATTKVELVVLSLFKIFSSWYHKEYI